MKKTVKKIISAVSAAIMLITSVSCTNTETAMTTDGHSITENEFRYYLATYKSRFSQMYTDFDDSDAFYSSVLDDVGMTSEEYLWGIILENVKMMLVSDKLFAENELTLPKSVTDEIDAYIDDFIKEYAGGSKSVFNSALAQYGINVKMLREIYLRDERVAYLYSYLFSEGGDMAVSDEDRAEYLGKNYVRVRHIYVNNKYKYAYDEDGFPIYSSEGIHTTVPLGDEEADVKNEVVSAIDAAIENGTDFEEIYANFSEDQYYENGYYLTRSTDFIDDVVTSAFELEIGEYVKLESDAGVHYIKRLEMDEKPWEEEANADFFDGYDASVSSTLFDEYIKSMTDEVEVNEEIIAKYNLPDSPMNYRF